MASLTQRQDGNKRWVVSFKNPFTNKWQKTTYTNHKQAVQALATHEYIETCKKIGSDDWKKIYSQAKSQKTLADIEHAYESNFLANKTNFNTIKRRRTAIGRLYQVFPKDTLASTLKHIKHNNALGWQIFKDHYAHLSRHTVNGYLTEISHMFGWAKDTELIDCNVITKHDLYSQDELPPIEHKVWQPQEVYTLLNHPDLTEYQRDFINVYVLTGLRVTELLGHVKHFDYKEFLWEHIDFKNNTLSVIIKRGKIRLLRRVHQDVMDVFIKWRNQGFERPLDFNYKYVTKNILPPIRMITGLNFTMHDLRRLNAQLVRPALGVEGAADSIGDSTLQVVEKHYAGISFAEMDRINDVVKNQLTIVTETATA